MTWGRRVTALLLLPLGVAACSSSTPSTVSPTPTARATATPPPTAASGPVTPGPPATPTARVAALTDCPTTPASLASLPVIFRGGQPDDLAVAADGSLWISDVGSGIVERVVAGAVTTTLRSLLAPEGLITQPTGSLIVAEQGRDRITLVHADGRSQVLVTLPPSNGVLGVDSIALDATGTRLLIPDSPHGTLLSAPVTGGATTTLASGLGRVVGVVADSGGGIWLAAEAEAPRGLQHVPAGGGTATSVGHLAQLDDVILHAGLLYATDLRGRSVHAIDPASGADRVIANGFSEPQGLVVLPDGRLAVADSPQHVVVALPPC
jgi:streptogramin lyase